MDGQHLESPSEVYAFPKDTLWKLKLRIARRQQWNPPRAEEQILELEDGTVLLDGDKDKVFKDNGYTSGHAALKINVKKV